MPDASKTNVVRVAIPCKDWIGDDPDEPPSADKARPSHCPACGKPAAPVGEPLTLHALSKHRTRNIRGIIEAPDSVKGLEEGAGERLDTQIVIRRYLCVRNSCKTSCTVVPCEVRAYAEILRPMVAFALALWTIHPDRPSAGQVRRWLFPSRRILTAGWPQLRRWAAELDELHGVSEALDDDLAPKRRAQHVSQICIARAPPDTRDRPPWARVVSAT